VRIVTAAPGGHEHRTTIWAVVDEADRVFVRSWRGAGARWFREAVRSGTAALIVAKDRVAVRVEPAADPDRVRSCSNWLERKYAGDPSTPGMVREEILETTLELRPV
jgi:hypothetical protein